MEQKITQVNFWIQPSRETWAFRSKMSQKQSGICNGGYQKVTKRTNSVGIVRNLKDLERYSTKCFYIPDSKFWIIWIWWTNRLLVFKGLFFFLGDSCKCAYTLNGSETLDQSLDRGLAKWIQQARQSGAFDDCNTRHIFVRRPFQQSHSW